ncbi:MAG TPA: leucyl aminopeptidase [Tepidisphaeraceae bacterium]|jgi:leucyl aminopeptidase|nr:leucyl aminopeptidase [Tepidisphaeraceae bacterium]
MIPTSTRANVKTVKSIPASVDAVAVFVHKPSKSATSYPSLPQAEQETLDRLIASGVVIGKSNDLTVHLLEGKTPRRLVVVGLGNVEKFSAECLREAGAAVARAAAKHRLPSVAISPPAVPADFPPVPGAKGDVSGIAGAIEALVEGIVVGSFDYQEYRGTARKSSENEQSRTIEFSIIGDAKQIGDAVDRGRIIGEGQNFARTIASRPGNNINPPSLAKVAQQLAAELKLSCRILDEKEMKRLGMGGILGVGSGSTNTPPRMIVLEYRGSRGSKDRPLLVVGKSITFDSGGISIKPADKMGRMIYDKSGGMAVLGLMYAVAKLKLPVHLVGILASAENILSATSYRPGDILHMYNGVTVDVTNTDAEGRLVLGDALAWGIETYRPAAVVDLATLTGGVVIALGKAMAGVMSNNDQLVDELTIASQRAGEKIWRLPIWDEHRQLMKGDSADLVNSGPARDASPLQGGAFLSYFVPWEGKDAVPWAHIDIAGVADTEKELPLYARGSTGWGVRTMVEWVRARASRQ